MSTDTMIAMSGLFGLAAAVVTGALWDSSLVKAPARVRAHFAAEGRHALR